MSGRYDHLHATVRRYVASRELAVGYDDYFSQSSLFRFDCDFIAGELAFPRPAGSGFSLLDLGCGTGRHLVFAARNGCLATGVDLNPHMLAEAEKNLRAAGIPYSRDLPPTTQCPVRVVMGDFTDRPQVRGERFDAAVMMFSTLGLVRTAALRLSLLAGIRQQLVSGGKLLLHVHNELRNRRYIPTWSLEHIRDFALRKTGELEEGDHIQARYRGVMDLYLHYFADDELRNLLADAGYRDIRLLYLNDRRDGEHPGPRKREDANGFLASAVCR